MFGDWFEHPTAARISAEAIGFQTSPDAWQAFAVTEWVLLATIVCAVSAAVVTASGVRLNLPIDASAAVAIMGIVATALIGWRVAEPIEIEGVTYRRELALLMGLGAAGLVALGGLLGLRERGTNLFAELARAGRQEAPLRDRLRRRAPGVARGYPPRPERPSTRRR
jgi:hypothetical protein